MANTPRRVIGGVDTHKDTHHAAVITVAGQFLGDKRFPATIPGIARCSNGGILSAIWVP
jgi:transposase